MNATSDSDPDWWPFVFLRPHLRERMSSRRVATLALLYGVPASLFATVLTAALGPVLSPRDLLGLVAAACIAIFAIYRGTVAYFWNRRAARLSPHRSEA